MHPAIKEFVQELDEVYEIKRRAGLQEARLGKLATAAGALSLLVAALTTIPTSPAEAGTFDRPKGVIRFVSDNPGFLKFGLPKKAQIDPALIQQAQQKLNQADYQKEGGNLWKVSWKGDCEDLSLAVYKYLKDAGVPAQSMRIMASPQTKDREAHAIFCVWTPEGPVCLDVMKQSPTNLKDIPGQWYDAVTGQQYQ